MGAIGECILPFPPNVVSMLREAIMAASRLEPQSRLTVVAGTVTGSPVSRPAIRPRFRLSSPASFALPKITSSIAPPSRCGLPFERGLDRVRGEVVGPDSGQCAVESAERGPHRVIQVRGCHDHSRSCSGEALNAEEHAEESVGESLVAAYRSAVEAPECRENEAAGIELDDRREVAHVALFVGHPIR